MLLFISLKKEYKTMKGEGKTMGRVLFYSESLRDDIKERLLDCGSRKA